MTAVHARTRRRSLALAVLSALVLVACGGDGDSGTIEGGDAAKTPAADRVIEVRMLPERRFEPATIAVKAGETITFKVVNQADVFHEFMLGDEEMHAARDKMMMDMGSEPMRMDDEANSVTLAGGETKELTWTFDKAGTVLYGCHQPGHYDAGMKGTVTVS